MLPPSSGGVRERPNRTVSKTVVGQPTVGSNPTPSAPAPRREPRGRIALGPSPPRSPRRGAGAARPAPAALRAPRRQRGRRGRRRHQAGGGHGRGGAPRQGLTGLTALTARTALTPRHCRAGTGGWIVPFR